MSLKSWSESVFSQVSQEEIVAWMKDSWLNCNPGKTGILLIRRCKKHFAELANTADSLSNDSMCPPLIKAAYSVRILLISLLLDTRILAVTPSVLPLQLARKHFFPLRWRITPDPFIYLLDELSQLTPKPEVKAVKGHFIQFMAVCLLGGWKSITGALHWLSIHCKFISRHWPWSWRLILA